MKKITIITGHYGCGKTNLSVNLAIDAVSEGCTVVVVDFDLVNPYFRTADFKQLFTEKNIKLITPKFANSNLDIPSIQFDIKSLASSADCLIIDVGGDAIGACTLGRFADILLCYGKDLEIYYVINQCRNLTEIPEDTVKLLYEIESASHLRVTAIVNNTNLGCETTAKIIEESKEFAYAVAKQAGLPLAFTTCSEKLCEFIDIKDLYLIKIYVKPIWEH